jgi:hypothetical protein
MAIASCGTLDPREGNGIDPEFASYVARFERYYGRPIGDIPIYFAKMESNKSAGECWIWWGGYRTYREIRIDRRWWNQMGDTFQREILIFHELGHCELNRPHTEEMRNMFAPMSIMYPSVNVSHWRTYLLNHDYYIKELFAGECRVQLHDGFRD